MSAVEVLSQAQSLYDDFYAARQQFDRFLHKMIPSTSDT